jgi:hypothetical protein
VKQNNTRLGCIAVIVLFALTLAYLESIGSIHLLPGTPTPRPAQPSATRTPDPMVINLATVEAGSTQAVPLRAMVSGHPGLISADVVEIRGDSLYMELTVERGNNTLAFAQGLLELSRGFQAVNEFSVILWDRAGSVSYLWSARRGEWSVTDLRITPLPTLASFTPTRAYACNGVDDLNCGDFSRRAEAQAHMDACGDEDQLDADFDGLACEEMP